MFCEQLVFNDLQYYFIVDIFFYRAGIRPGDVITKVNQKEVLSADMIMALMEDGDTFQLTVHRGPKTFKCTVSLVEPVMPWVLTILCLENFHIEWN